MENLKKILRMETPALAQYVHSIIGGKIEPSNYIWLKSKESPLMICAHMDTVRKEDKPLILSLKKKILVADGILGADDRAGVWTALEIYKQCKAENTPIPSFLFTDGEESGGTGMVNFIDSRPKLKGTKLIIALDRTGCNEYVTYNHLPMAVREYMESFGYKMGNGSFNDITYLTEEYRIPSVNISVGYYGAHTIHESLHLDELLFCFERVMNVVRSPIDKLHKSNGRYYDYGYVGRRSKKERDAVTYAFYCDVCGKEDNTYLLDEYGDSWLCKECIETYAEKVCHYCGGRGVHFVDNEYVCSYCHNWMNGRREITYV